ncbi:serine/threonine-protein kinase NIM1 [Aedes aegypti]|uniref:non-specific serine/threonine protein kinase n=1 Tax=Aedes aegypti TaxID=7159 RepID=A0A6I8TEY4_AEDAE|nr:serine/threonine-protein kinase NIM1 [Aedes aegypti]
MKNHCSFLMSTAILMGYHIILQQKLKIFNGNAQVALGRRIGFYRFCGDIGRGNFSRVKLAIHQLTKDKVAIKVVDTSRLDAKALRMLSKEVSTLEAAFHPFILRLFEVIDTIGKIYLVSEWIPGGELYSRIVDIGVLEEYHAAVIFYQLLIAVKYLHSLGYVHRDIKAENILMINEERIKLADFGFSTQLINGSNQHLDTFCGSPPYAAPELFSDDHYVGGPVSKTNIRNKITKDLSRKCN